MKRKTVRAVTAAAKPPPRRKAFSKVDFKRAISAARSVNLPVSRVDIGRDGNVSLVIGKTISSGDDPINEQQLKELI